MTSVNVAPWRTNQRVASNKEVWQRMIIKVGESMSVNVWRPTTEDIYIEDLTASTVSSREVDDDCTAERPSPINLVPWRTNQCFAGRPTVTFSITSRILCMPPHSVGAFCRAILCISGTRGGSRILVGGGTSGSPPAESRGRAPVEVWGRIPKKPEECYVMRLKNPLTERKKQVHTDWLTLYDNIINKIIIRYDTIR